MKRKRSRKTSEDPRRPASEYMREGGWSEHFAYIAGFTEGGAPFGTTWDELEEAELRESEAAAVRAERRLSPKTLRVDMNDLEMAFETRSEEFHVYLDTETGRVLTIPGFGFGDEISEEMQEDMELIDTHGLGRFFPLETFEDLRASYHDARQFIETVENTKLQERLRHAIGQRRHAFRRFLDVLYGEVGEWERWHRYARERLRENIAQFLRREGITVVYEPIPPPKRPETRQYLIAGAVECVENLCRLPGIRRIALIGSIVTAKTEPKDVDLLVTINADADLRAIAARGRKLKGYAQQINRGADIFLATEDGRYLGRTCPWRECAPGIRRACEAQHCGTYLYDDLHVIRLDSGLIQSPPLEVWPDKTARGDIPADVLHAFGELTRKTKGTASEPPFTFS